MSLPVPALRLERLQQVALAVAVIGTVLAIGAAVTAPQQFYPAYLVAFFFWLGLSLGSLAISMIHHLTGGGWGVPIRRILESATTPLPLMAVLFLPVVVGMRVLYVWSRPEVMAHDEILQSKVKYLNEPRFLICAAVYFAIWIAWAFFLNRGTATSDPGVQQRRQEALSIGSAIGLILWGLAVTFSSIDWGMSLEPHWYSSMYGVLFMAGQAVSAMSLALIFAILLRPSSLTFNVLTTSRLNDLGNFLLAFVMFWSYVSFMQFLIIWSANLPEETPWYLRRSRGGWEVVVALLMIAHFLVPFLLLLMRPIKRKPARLLMVAATLLVMRLVDLTWLVYPTFTEHLCGTLDVSQAGHGVMANPSGSVLDLWPLLVTVPAIGGWWLAMFAWRLRYRMTLPVYEANPGQEAEHELAH